MAQSISAIAITCLRAFSSLGRRLQDERILTDSCQENIVLSNLLDELGRLRVWTANIGAHQQNQSSLDYRLRDASHIKDQTIDLLVALESSLQDIDDLLTKENAEDSVGEEELDELHELYKEVVTIINGLYQMSMMIRRPARHDRLLRLSAIDKTSYEPWDVKHVQEKFPAADAGVTERLGRAITRRRRYLEYHERHHKKLGQGLDKEERGDRDEMSTQFSKTIATDFDPDIVFEDALSQTSYASSVEGDEGVITVPPPPKESVNGAPFECPYCYFVINVRDPHSWRRHVFHDLQPYLCVYPECVTPDKFYESRHEWFSHELSVHISETSSITCTLCRSTMGSTGKLKRHLIRHLEELALFVVPQTYHEEEDKSNRESCESSIGRLDKVRTDLSDVAEASPGASDEDERITGLRLDRENEPYENDDKSTSKAPWFNTDADIMQRDTQEGFNDDSPINDPASTVVTTQLHHISKPFQDIAPAGPELSSLMEYDSPAATLGDSAHVLPTGLTDAKEAITRGITALKVKAGTGESAEADEATVKTKAKAKATVQARAEADEDSSKPKAEADVAIASAKAKAEANDAGRAGLPLEKEKPLKFKDALGRKFAFPFHLCRTWNGMEEFIKQAFLHVQIIGPHVAEGHYDLVGPNGEIILPQLWETTVKPDWTVTMHLWPFEPS